VTTPIVGVFNISQIVYGRLRTAYLGYYVLEPFAGQGYMHDGLALVLRFAFGPLGLHRLEANIQPENESSIALVKRAGFRLEGYSPRYVKVAGRWWDHERWAILAEDLPRRPGGSGRTT
jgi:[ribosomal protein S5]-alanine N-acetyltransferase